MKEMVFMIKTEVGKQKKEIRHGMIHSYSIYIHIS